MRKTIRPDIHIERKTPAGKDRIILDTKWKVPRDGRPDDADLKQMYAYNLQFGAQQSYLIYPNPGKRTHIDGQFQAPTRGGLSLDNACGMKYVELLDEDGKLDPSFGSRLSAALSA